MDIEVNREKLEFLQSFFVKSFWLNFFLIIFSTIICFAMHNWQVTFLNNFIEIDSETFTFIILLALTFWKILIIQFTLVPALVIWIIRHCGKCECEYKQNQE